MRPIIRQSVVDALAKLTADQLAALVNGTAVSKVFGDDHAWSGPCSWFFDKIATPLSLSYANHLITGPLTRSSARALDAYWRDPNRTVPDTDDGLPELDFAALDFGHVVRHIHWVDLPEPLCSQYRGPHCHGTIKRLRNRLGEEEYIWTDGDPTKGSAWDIRRPITDPAAIALLGGTPSDRVAAPVAD